MASSPLYSTSVQIKQFSGMNQSGDGYNMNMQLAREMENVNVSGGSYQPMRAGLRIEQELTAPIGTLAYLSRRWGNDASTLLVAICDGKVFTKHLDQDDEWVQRYTGLSVNDCDWITYEVNYRDGQALPEPVDVLLFSNATDGMFCLYGDTLAVAAVTTPKKFGVITRYNERIWGAGIEGDPDMLVYSAPFDPFDWDQNDEIPEDGAGDIMQPTWDGDSFVALRQYGSNLLAIKKNSIWRIYGTNPGEFSMQREYGGGTIVENTVAVFDDKAYMLGDNGILRYDGTGAYAFLQDEVRLLMDKVNRSALHKAYAGMRDGTYCVALPINGSDYCNAVLEYNTRERTIALRTEVDVGSFVKIATRLFYTSATYPGRIYEMQDKVGNTLNTKWVSGYQDLGLKSSIKSAFILYAMVESEAPVELRIGIRTEKKLKQKIIYTKPGKQTRIHLNTQGRFFRLEIETYTAVPFSISGGIKLDLELDPD